MASSSSKIQESTQTQLSALNESKVPSHRKKVNKKGYKGIMRNHSFSVLQRERQALKRRAFQGSEFGNTVEDSQPVGQWLAPGLSVCDVSLIHGSLHRLQIFIQCPLCVDTVLSLRVTVGSEIDKYTARMELALYGLIHSLDKSV